MKPQWRDVSSSAYDRKVPQMRAAASSYYILMITFVGLALQPFSIGQISDFYMASGLGDGAALRSAMMWSLIIFAGALALLTLAMRHLPADEARRIELANQETPAAPP